MAAPRLQCQPKLATEWLATHPHYWSTEGRGKVLPDVACHNGHRRVALVSQTSGVIGLVSEFLYRDDKELLVSLLFAGRGWLRTDFCSELTLSFSKLREWNWSSECPCSWSGFKLSVREGVRCYMECDFAFVLESQKKSVLNDFLWPCSIPGLLSIYFNLWNCWKFQHFPIFLLLGRFWHSKSSPGRHFA